MIGTIFDVKEFTIHDGPGIRTTIFFKGCPLRCIWCHNPEGLSSKPQLMITENGCINCGKCKENCTHVECKPFKLCTKCCPKGLIKITGKEISSDELSAQIKKQVPLFESSGGGVTISGGEPLNQPEFLIDLLKKLAPLNRIIETSGHGDSDSFRKIISLCDEVYFDIKHSDSAKHKELTGVDNTLILQNLDALKKSGIAYTVRIPIIPELNDDEQNLIEIADIVRKNKRNLQHVELMQSNPFAEEKYKLVGIPFNLANKNDGKTPEKYLSIFESRGLSVRILQGLN